MPIIAASHFILDLPTLLAVTFFVTVVGGLLLLFAFLQNLNTPALAFWGVGYLIGAAGAALIAGASVGAPNVWSVCAANALLCGAYAFMWSGARSFEGRRISIALLAAGPAIWLVAFQFESFAQSTTARIGLVSAISATYAFLGACELWYARDRELISRWPTLLLVVGHAGFLVARIPFASTLAASAMSGHAQGAVVTVIRRGDLFGRLGGEEFAYLLADASMAQALQTAERLRRDFAAIIFPGLVINPTVSVGVAMASEAGRNLSTLLAVADRALYRAKADGGNRVASAPLILVEAAGDVVRRSDRAAVTPAPIAG